METKGTMDVTFVAPLDKFDAELDSLLIGAEVVLSRVKDKDKRFLRKLVGSGAGVGYAVPKADFALETTLASVDIIPDANEASERFARVVTAFRLIKRGAFGLPVLIACETGSRALKAAFGPFRPHAFGEPYFLGKQEADKLRNVVQELCAGRLSDRQNIALRRFEMAYERGIAEDRLIDYWVALEALFLPDIFQELSFRASLRIAYYVAGTPDEREEVFRKMRLSYDIRSDVVHGQRLKADVSEVASDTEEILRRALRAEVMNPGSLNVDRLDAAIARGQGAAQSGGAR